MSVQFYWLLLVFLLTNVLVTCVTAPCNLPPSLWCSSRDVARQCQVELHCDQYVWQRKEHAQPVNFALYYEALCGGCRAFIKLQLYPVFQKIGNIMNITLVPYGNARENWDGKKWEFMCQHGPDECQGNLIETCSIHLLKDIHTYFPYIHCIEVSPDLPSVSAKTCATQLGIDFNPIEKCANGSLGNKLEHQMALKTDALQPKHNFVPWVTLNGVHNDDIQNAAVEDLLKLICDTYQGPIPAVCEQFHKVTVQSVCTKDQLKWHN